MKKTICLNCGEINSGKAKCSNCKKPNSQFKDVLNEAKDIYRYGYKYRIYYEKQFELEGKINTKPSLYIPETLPEFLTTAALAGIVGNLSYLGFTVFARNLLNLIKGKIETDKYAEIIKLVTNDEELKLFFQYVSDYYWQRPNNNIEIHNSIEEEMINDFISNSIVTSEIQKTFETDDKDEASKLRLEIIRKAYKDYREFKENKNPVGKEQLNELFKEVKTPPNKS